MQTNELLAIIANGEDSRHQFKATIKHAEALAAEMTKVPDMPEVPTNELPTIAVQTPTKDANKQPARVAVAS